MSEDAESPAAPVVAYCQCGGDVLVAGQCSSCRADHHESSSR